MWGQEFKYDLTMCFQMGPLKLQHKASILTSLKIKEPTSLKESNRAFSDSDSIFSQKKNVIVK